MNFTNRAVFVIKQPLTTISEFLPPFPEPSLILLSSSALFQRHQRVVGFSIGCTGCSWDTFSSFLVVSLALQSWSPSLLFIFKLACPITVSVVLLSIFSSLFFMLGINSNFLTSVQPLPSTSSQTFIHFSRRKQLPKLSRSFPNLS